MRIRGYSLNSWARTRHILRGRIKTTSWYEQTHHPRGIKTPLTVFGQGIGNHSYHTVILLVTDRHPRCGVSVIFAACASSIFYTYSPSFLHLQGKLFAPAELKCCVNDFYFWPGKMQYPNSKFLHSIELHFCHLACFWRWIFVHVQYRNILNFSLQPPFITCRFKKMPPTKQVIA